MSRSPFPAVRIAGGLLPPDLFTRALADKDLPGREPDAYGLSPHESVREAAARAFDYLNGAWQAFTRERGKAAQEGRSPRTRGHWLLPLFDKLGYGVLQPSGGFSVGDTDFPVSHCWGRVPIHLLGWDADLDHRTKGVAGAAHRAPQSMVQDLLKRSDDHLWAILANGGKLRLLHDSRALAGSAYVEFDLELIFSEQLFPDFVLLYRLVHATRFAVPEGKTSADCYLEQWRADAAKSGERALARLRKGVELAINTLGTGFLQHPANDLLRKRLAGNATADDLSSSPLYGTEQKRDFYGDLDKLTTLSKEDYNRAILRLVYRLLFWFVAEDRDVLLEPVTADESAPMLLAARDRYTKYFSAQRLRDRALRGGADPHDDLWQAVKLVFDGLGTQTGLSQLAVPGIGGLFERITELPDGTRCEPSLPDELDAPLEGMRISNSRLLQAVRHLAVVDSGTQRRPVNFRELDSEELGSVYESLLELHPDLDADDRTFTLRRAAGNERKTTGSYYTPSSLTEALLETALNPVLDEAARGAEPAEAKVEALLGVTVCDPACGSGHFLVAAARRIARRIAEVRSGEDEPSPDLVRHAMREVVSRCIYGVDINEMAAELAKVSLWLESVEPGRPLAFLDANIRVGNALLGATPALISRGIPKEAFKPIEGDDKKVASAVAKESETEKAQAAKGVIQDSLFGEEAIDRSNTRLAARTRELVGELPEDLAGLVVQRRRLRALDAERRPMKRVADAWCAAFVQELTSQTRLSAIKHGTLAWIGGDDLDERQRTMTEKVDELARDYRFFHWHVEFPHLFRVPENGPTDPQTGWDGGFTCVIGNPPWERVKIQEKEFFAARNEDIASAKNAAARKKAIAALKDSEEEADRRLYAEFVGELRQADGATLLLRDSGRYPLTGRGDINTYAVFAETGRTLLAPHGRVGMVLPTGIATDATTQFFFKDMVETKTLASLYDFENEEKLFPNVHNQFRFCLWSASGRRAPQEHIRLAFRLRKKQQITEREFVLTPGDIVLLNPNTGTCPVFDHKRNADITVGIYRRVPVLWREPTQDGEGLNPWGLSFMAMLHMANDSGLFRPSAANGETLTGMLDEGWELKGNVLIRNGERLLPLYEAKMLHHFDHRFSTYLNATQAQLNKGTLPRSTPEQKEDPAYVGMPEYWVPEEAVEDRLCPQDAVRGDRRKRRWEHGWLLGWRDICRSADTRTVISTALPRAAVGDKFLLALPERDGALLQANLTSLVLDFCARQKISGTSLKYFIFKQLPVLPPEAYERDCPWYPDERLDRWVRTRVLELTYTSYDMEAFARDHGDDGPPYRWDEERRFWLRAELDAAYFHLYGVTRDDVDYILGTFRAFQNVSPDLFARTRKAIGEIYDAMADAIAGRAPYRTVLDPAPGHGPRHPARPALEAPGSS
ncbi:Eco57I restriction-modification methylase domain-containing protein [Planomonospora sp. ID82291]|uniref:Eco57I restriction-modification methylase domain-containing protein n=1 Tax=Planomonospora sp. ID82291 TaxID=2738136 RepID=UPI0018C3C2AA|nr:N-6 DNA methylase [Planomonospora sp. ID82291]MBG0818401.1 N-6 DNA methylase [Planomonospora sp. ID82291]